VQLKQLNRDAWNDRLSSLTIPHIYLDPRWLHIIEKIYPGLPIWRLMFDAEKGSSFLPLVGISPLFKGYTMGISLPFGNYGGFLYENSTSKPQTGEVQEVLDTFAGEVNLAMVEIRHLEKPEPFSLVDDRFKRFVITFPPTVDELWQKQLTGNARTSVRKAERMGVNVCWQHPHALEIFQSLNEKNAAWHGTPLHHHRWYPNIVESFGQQCEIVVALIDEKPVGALFLLYHGSMTILHAAVTDNAYRKIPITDKMLWESFVQLLNQKQMKLFDFGRTRPVNGKLFFKRKWGGVEQPLYYTYVMHGHVKIPESLPENPRFQVAQQIWRLLPLSVQRHLGPIFRKRIPT